MKYFIYNLTRDIQKHTKDAEGRLNLKAEGLQTNENIKEWWDRKVTQKDPEVTRQLKVV